MRIHKQPPHHSKHHHEHPVLYTKEGDEVPFPYIVHHDHKPRKKREDGIHEPRVIEDTLVFTCGDYKVHSKPYKHFYTNNTTEKTGIHRVTDKKSRKQITEYYLEEIQIHKKITPQNEINILGRGKKTQNWLETIIPNTTFILSTHHGDKLQIDAISLFNNRKPFIDYSYITTTAYKPEFMQTVIASATEFLLLSINRIYHKYGRAIFNYLHNQELTDRRITCDTTIQRDEENIEFTIKGDVYDQRTLEQIHEAKVIYYIDEIQYGEEETIYEGKLEKLITLNPDGQDHTLKMCITAEGYDTYCENMQLVQRKQTNLNILQDVFTTTPGGEISVDVEVEDDTGEPVSTGRVELYSNEEKTSIDDIIEEDDDNP